jgi:glycerol-3-phosphate dehydrogenase (NAD(P)+)
MAGAMSRPIQVAVLGGGSWGTTVASLAARHAQTTLWARSEETAAEIRRQHCNSRYLPDLDLHPELDATSSLADALAAADVLVVGVPSHGLRATLVEAAPHIRPWIPILSLTKGLEQGTRLRPTEIISELLPGHPAGVLSGPNLAREVLSGYAAAAVVAMPDAHVATSLQAMFASPLFRVYTSTDVLGCELGGVLKNVIAIAAGMAEGLGVGDNTRAMVITRGLAEITRLGVAMGGEPATFAGLTGLGDLMATCMSPLSRNRRVGEELARGRSIEAIQAGMNMVAEGVKTARTVTELGREYGVPLPIAEEVDAVVNDGRSAEEAFRGLRRTQAGSELQAG